MLRMRHSQQLQNRQIQKCRRQISLRWWWNQNNWKNKSDRLMFAFNRLPWLLFIFRKKKREIPTRREREKNGNEIIRNLVKKRKKNCCVHICLGQILGEQLLTRWKHFNCWRCYDVTNTELWKKKNNNLNDNSERLFSSISIN